MNALKQKILNLVDHSENKLSQISIENMVYAETNTRRREIRKAIASLISEGELQYTYVFGNSYIEKSFNRPVRVSSSVIVKPYNMTYHPADTDIVISIFPGVSFGAGDHPTTRLSVQGIEFVLRKHCLIEDIHHSSMLDIGTGSGILAIAALKFGIETGRGIDTDPCSVSEAKKNALINGLENRLTISAPPDRLEETFSLITANLRFPDIMKLCPLISNHCHSGAPVVVSGIRPEEVCAVIDKYTGNGFSCLWRSTEKNWACLVLKKQKEANEHHCNER